MTDLREKLRPYLRHNLRCSKTLVRERVPAGWVGDELTGGVTYRDVSVPGTGPSAPCTCGIDAILTEIPEEPASPPPAPPDAEIEALEKALKIFRTITRSDGNIWIGDAEYVGSGQVIARAWRALRRLRTGGQP